MQWMIQNLQTFPYSPSTFVKKLKEKKILFIAPGFSFFKEVQTFCEENKKKAHGEERLMIRNKPNGMWHD